MIAFGKDGVMGKSKSGDVAIVTGAGSGVGRAAALGLLAEGYRVALLGRRLPPLEETIQLGGAPDRSLALSIDVSDEAQVEAAFAAIVKRFGRVDLLFNNAGVMPAPSSFAD